MSMPWWCVCTWTGQVALIAGGYFQRVWREQKNSYQFLILEQETRIQQSCVHNAQKKANQMQKPFEPLQSKSSPGMLSSADSRHKTKIIFINIYMCIYIVYCLCSFLLQLVELQIHWLHRPCNPEFYHLGFGYVGRLNSYFFGLEPEF